jgi:hypothetical protein
MSRCPRGTKPLRVTGRNCLWSVEVLDDERSESVILHEYANRNTGPHSRERTSYPGSQTQLSCTTMGLLRTVAFVVLLISFIVFVAFFGRLPAFR